MGTNNNQIKTILRDRVNPKSTGGWYKLIKGIQSDGVAYIDTLSKVHHLYHYQIIDLYHYQINTTATWLPFCGYGSAAVSSGSGGCYTGCYMTGSAHSTWPNTLSGPSGDASRNATIIANGPWYNRHIIFTEGYNGGSYGGWFSLYNVDTGTTHYPNGIDDRITSGISLGTSKLFCRGEGATTISPIDPFVVIYEYQLFNGTNSTDFMTEKVHLFPCILTQNIDGSLDSKGVARLKGTVGMYDSLSGKFFANAASSGQFIAVLS